MVKKRRSKTNPTYMIDIEKENNKLWKRNKNCKEEIKKLVETVEIDKQLEAKYTR